MNCRRTLAVALLALAVCGCKRWKTKPVTEIEVSNPAVQGRLESGFYPPTGTARWRWTERSFAVNLDVPSIDREVYLELEYGLPEELLNEVSPVTLIGSVNGVEVGRETYSRPGHYVFTHYVPKRALKPSPARVEFELDRSAALPDSGRVIGLNAIGVGLKRYENTIEARQNQILLARQGYLASLEQTSKQLGPQRVLELKKLFARLPGFGELKFHNVAVRENPMDLWALQQILWEVQPEAVVMTGVGQGGAALYVAQVLDGLGLDRARVVAVGTEPLAQAAAQHFLRKKYIDFLQGEAGDAATLERVRAAVAGRRAVVVLNGEGPAETVLATLKAYAPLVRSGGYLVVENTEANAVSGQLDPEPGALAAIDKFMAEGGAQAFEADRGREMALYTRNAGGWLRRK